MSYRQLLVFASPFFLLILVGIWMLPEPEERSGDNPVGERRVPETLHFVTLASDPQKVQEEFVPFVAFLNQRLAGTDIVLKPSWHPNLHDLLIAHDAGRVDFFIETPFPVMCAIQEKGMHPILRQWKGGIETYHSVILVPVESGITNLFDLQGRIIAVESNRSTTSFFLPLAELQLFGIETTHLEADKRLPPEDQAGYVFSTKDAISMDWALQGRVAAAAVSSLSFADYPREKAKHFHVLHETMRVPCVLVATRKDLNPIIQDQVLDLLLNLETYPQGREALQAFGETRRFDLIPYERDLMERLSALLAQLPCDP